MVSYEEVKVKSSPAHRSSAPRLCCRQQIVVCKGFTQSTQGIKNIKMQFIYKDKVFSGVPRQDEVLFPGQSNYPSIIKSYHGYSINLLFVF
jgi:hypothetical protein